MTSSVWRDVLLISIGAVIGANLRYGINRLALKYLSASLPYGTLIVNVTGSLLVGFFLAWTGERVVVSPQWRALVAVGFCGAYTTFSSYGYETVALFEQGHYSLAVGNFVANNVLVLAAVVCGMVLARSI